MSRAAKSFLLVSVLILSAKSEPLAGCAAIAGAEQLWINPGVRFIVVGEIHGTNETPAIFADLVCSARQAKRPIVVGVELREQKAIEKFIRSADTEAAVHDLLSIKEWSRTDGRTSRAMVKLLEQLRAFKREGAISGIVGFSQTRAGETPAMGEKRMASSLRAASNGYPNALVIALTGNVHACKKAIPELGPDPWMASFLPDSETVSLVVTDRGGEAWNCEGDVCGPHKLDAGGGLERGITLSKTAVPLPGFDGILSTGLKATPSPPAVPNPATPNR